MLRTLACALFLFFAAAKSPGTTLAQPDVRRRLHDICLAFVQKNDAPCQASNSERAECLSYARALPVLRAYAARDPAFHELCLRLAQRYDAGSAASASSQETCRAWWSYSGDPSLLSEAIEDSFQAPPSRKDMLQILGEMTLDRNACDAAADPVQREICRQAADYRDALAAKDPGRCRGGICRALRGDGASACISYAPDAPEATAR